MSRTFRRAGKWWVDYQDTHTGKRVRKPAGATKSEAEDRLARIRTGQEVPAVARVAKPTEPTLDRFADEYLKWKLGKASHRVDEEILRGWRRLFGDRPLSAITTGEIEQYKARRMTEKVRNTNRVLSPRRVNYELVVLKALFNKAIKWGKAQRNPANQVEFLKVNDARTDYLDPQEIRSLLAACSGRLAHLKPIVTIALHTGMRRGEILALKWSDVDYARNRIRIRASKNGTGRDVPMGLEVLEALRSCVSLRQVVEGEDGPVFCNNQGKPRKEIRNAFKSALRKAEIKNYRFHDLRHTFASQLRNDGVDITIIQELMGHKSLAMTMRYAHLHPARGKEAVARLGRIYGTREAQEPVAGKASDAER